MIRERKALNMCEVNEMLSQLKETEKTKALKTFLKKFSKISPAKAKELKKELEDMGIIKLKEADIAKIIDLMPEDSVELNKIFVDVTLDGDETNKILGAIKKYL